MQLQISSTAKTDLREIWRYVAVDNLDAADRLIETIYEEFELLRNRPKLGRKRDDLAPDLRSFPISSYLIFYRITENCIKIMRVLSGYRDITSFF